MRLAIHLWTSGPPPIEYIDLVLCRDVYHGLPDGAQTIDEIPMDTIADHLICLDMESKIRSVKARR